MNLTFLTGKVEKIERIGEKTIVQMVSITKANESPKYDTHRVVAYGRVANYINSNFKFGDIVFVQARIQSRKVHEQDEVRYESEIVVWTIYRIV